MHLRSIGLISEFDLLTGPAKNYLDQPGLHRFGELVTCTLNVALCVYRYIQGVVPSPDIPCIETLDTTLLHRFQLFECVNMALYILSVDLDLHRAETEIGPPPQTDKKP